MRDMRLVWPRWIAFLAISAALWSGLSLLAPRADRVTGVLWQKLASEALEADAMRHTLGEDGRLPAGDLRVAGGRDCEAAADAELRPRLTGQGEATVVVTCRLQEGWATLTAKLEGPDGRRTLLSSRTRPLSGLSLLPPLLAIVFAFLFRRVVVALLLGIVLGALLVEDFAPWPALHRTVVDYVGATAVDPWNLTVYGFTLALLGMVHVCIAMGGMQGVVEQVARVARGVRSTQVATALMGIAVFFDDYANSVVVGGAARSLADERGISREKLAYIVDSTAAPIAGIAFISTWIGVEIDYFQEVLPQLGALSDAAPSGYAFFFASLPFRFYCFLAVALVLMVAVTGRDLGPMRHAERLARQGRPTRGRRLGELYGGHAGIEAREDAPARWWNGVIPILVVIVGTLAASTVWGGLKLTRAGRVLDWASAADLRDAFIAVGDDSMTVLFGAAILGSAVAVGLALGQRILGLRQALVAWGRGVVSMLPAIGVLILAMTITKVTQDLFVGQYLSGLAGGVPVELFPLVVFIVSGLVAFATGTSWATMGILIPVALPAVAHLLAGSDVAHPEVILFLVGASVLDGAIFGDHCSLISDTSVMSSIASGCDHVEHVRTQLPYALLAMLAAALCGYGLVGWLGPAAWWASLPLGLGVLFLGLRGLGGRAEDG